MILLYLTACRVYGPRLREVNNTYRASIAGQHPGVLLGGPGFDAPLDVPLDLPTYVKRTGADAVFIADPWHNFWDPCDTYPDCPPLFTGIDEVDVPIVIESGDSQFYHAEIIRHLQARWNRAVCIRALSHEWRFNYNLVPLTTEPTQPPADLRGSNVFYLPHGAYDEMVEVSRGVQKTVDVLFSGSDMPDAYPARAWIAAALRTMPDIKVDWLPHPSDMPAGTAPVIGPAFWRRIARARIAVAGTNCYRNLTMRYLEIPACGTLTIGDVPWPEGEREDLWREHMIDVTDDAMAAAIVGGQSVVRTMAQKIRDPLAMPAALAERTRVAREFVLTRHAFRAEWARVFGEIETWANNP